MELVGFAQHFKWTVTAEMVPSCRGYLHKFVMQNLVIIKFFGIDNKAINILKEQSRMQYFFKSLHFLNLVFFLFISQKVRRYIHFDMNAWQWGIGKKIFDAMLHMRRCKHLKF